MGLGEDIAEREGKSRAWKLGYADGAATGQKIVTVNAEDAETIRRSLKAHYRRALNKSFDTRLDSVTQESTTYWSAYADALRDRPEF